MQPFLPNDVRYLWRVETRRMQNLICFYETDQRNWGKERQGRVVTVWSSSLGMGDREKGCNLYITFPIIGLPHWPPFFLFVMVETTKWSMNDSQKRTLDNETLQNWIGKESEPNLLKSRWSWYFFTFSLISSCIIHSKEIMDPSLSLPKVHLSPEFSLSFCIICSFLHFMMNNEMLSFSSW